MNLNDSGDDFDSFFNAKKSLSSTQIKSSKILDPMEYLFGSEEKNDDRLLAGGGKTSAAGVKPKIMAEIEDDDDLGFDPKKPKATKKSQNILDDLLAPLEAKRPQTASALSSKAPISRQSTDTTTENSNIFQAQTTVRPRTSQGRRTSNLSSVQNPDPLSLFTKDKDSSKTPSRLASPKTQKRGTTADWLGLSKEPETESSKTEVNTETPKPTSVHKITSKDKVEELKLTDTNDVAGTETEVPEEQTEEVRKVIPKMSETLKQDTTNQQFVFMNTLNMETQQNISSLKYQEQQLIMATQMKQQERVLMDMQRKQDTLLQQQEHQFQKLFEQQMQRHQQLEELIKQQQQRINNHLHLLMTQPPLTQNVFDLYNDSNPPAKEENIEQNVEAITPSNDLVREKQITLEVIQYESDNKRLELENLRLEELISNTKSSYEREIELLEKSYKKQIEVLEQHLASVEKRLKAELEDLQLHFQNKITALEQEKNDTKKTYEEELSNLKQDHEDELRKMRKHQQEDLELLKEEHGRMLDHIRQAKMLEFAAVQENGSYLDCLKVASNNLEDLTGGLKELKENMHNKIETLQLEREKSLEQREKRLQDAERRLKITEDSNELEKKRLMDLVSSLELQMSKMSKESAEENWQLRQKLASLDSEKLAFDKEKEFFREQMLRDEERIKDLKEQQLMETQKLHIQLQEERTQLQVEKSTFNLEKRLQSNNDLQKERLEIETAIQVAQDAVQKADVERERFYKMQRQLEQQKRDLNDKEHALNVREEELQQELLSYRLADKAAQEAQQKAKIAEQFYQNKLHLLQQRANEIVEKENSLSQERLLLAQDRLAVHALKTKLSQQPKCSLCQLSQKNQEMAQSLNSNFPLNSATAMPREFTSSPGNYDYFQQTNFVERLLDANIADSLKKMHSNSNLVYEWQNFLDDDHKKMVQNEETEMPENKNNL